MTSQQPTGHDKAVDIVALEVARRRDGFSTVTTRQAVTMILAALRAALAAGDPDVAEALGLSEQRGSGEVPGRSRWRRFVTDWREVSGE